MVRAPAGCRLSRLHTSARPPAPDSKITVGLPWPRHSRYSFRPPISTRPEKSPGAAGEEAAKAAPCAAMARDVGPAGRMPARKRTNAAITGWRSMMFSLGFGAHSGPSGVDLCRRAFRRGCAKTQRRTPYSRAEQERIAFSLALLAHRPRKLRLPRTLLEFSHGLRPFATFQIRHQVLDFDH
jgi:hypothetical protein